MKTTSLAEAMICAFSAIIEAMPSDSQARVISILNVALASKAIEDADARAVVECLTGRSASQH